MRAELAEVLSVNEATFSANYQNFSSHTIGEIRDLALQLRALVLEEMTPCYESIYDACSAVAIGYGTSERPSDGNLSSLFIRNM